MKCLLPIHYSYRGLRLSIGAAAGEQKPRLVECQVEDLPLELEAPFGCKTVGLGIGVSGFLRAMVRVD